VEKTWQRKKYSKVLLLTNYGLTITLKGVVAPWFTIEYCQRNFLPVVLNYDSDDAMH
jgi:hypothetical protein